MINEMEPFRQVTLAKGFTLEIGHRGEELRILSDHGTPLKICITEQGPIIEMDAPRVHIRNTGDLCLEAAQIEFHAHKNMSLNVGGNCTQTVAGNMDIKIRDDFSLNAQAASLEAVRGGMALKASDDLDLQGLRILHNVPSEEELLEKLAKVTTFGEFMKCPAYDPQSPRKLKAAPPVPREKW